MDEMLLINEVKKRRVLWDSTMKMTKRKDTIDSEWFHVACIMQTSLDAVKKRFKSLRDHYRIEIRKMQQQNNYYPKMPRFKYLDFLRPIFDPTNIITSRPWTEESNTRSEISSPQLYTFKSKDADSDISDAIIDIEDDDSFVYDVISGDIFNQKRVSNITTHPQLEEMSQQQLSTPPPEKKLKCNGMVYMEKVPSLQASTEKTSYSTTAKDIIDDSDYSFLISMLPHMKTLTEMGNLKFRIEVSKILMDIKQGEIAKQAETVSKSKDPETHERLRTVEIKTEYSCKTPPEFIDCDIKVEADKNAHNL